MRLAGKVLPDSRHAPSSYAIAGIWKYVKMIFGSAVRTWQTSVPIRAYQHDLGFVVSQALLIQRHFLGESLTYGKDQKKESIPNAGMT